MGHLLPGANTPAPDLIRELVERRADVLAVSATMSFHVRAVTDLIAAVRSRLGDRVKVLVGGYPFNVDPDLGGGSGRTAPPATPEEAIDMA